MTKKLLSIVVSVYNEELSLHAFYDTVSEVLQNLTWDYELIFVNDGSRDKSLDILKDLAGQNKKIKVINFSRNYGHEAAMIAGIDHAKGDGIVCMDADLQHPPHMLPAIVEQFEDGYDVVSLVREANADNGIFHTLAVKAFYTMMNMMVQGSLEENASDFIAVSARAASVLRSDYREKVRFLRGYVQLLGFRRTRLTYEASNRVAGESKYNFRQLFKLAITSMCTLSDAPLRFGFHCGVVTGLFGLLVLIYTLYQNHVRHVGVHNALLIIVLCFLSAVMMILIGVLGEYMSVLLAEVKDRPIYLVADIIGDEEERSAS